MLRISDAIWDMEYVTAEIVHGSSEATKTKTIPVNCFLKIKSGQVPAQVGTG